MAENPFAKYASNPEVRENPFTKYTQAAETVPGPRREYALTEVPIEAVKNLPESAGKFVSGIAQSLIHPIDTAQSLGQLIGGSAFAVLPENAQSWLIEHANNPEKVKESINMANALGRSYKEKYGSFEGAKRAIAEDPVGVAADLSTALTGGGAAVSKLGAVKTGAALSKAGAVINPMRPIAPIIEAPFKLAGKGAGAISRAFDPKGQAYLTAVEDRGQQVLNALRQPSEIVENSLPTAAQAAAPVNATRFSALGESARGFAPTQYFERAEAQKAAQLAAIRKIGKTPADLAAAEALRSDTAKQLYGVADKATIEADNVFTSLLNRPSMDKVLARASDLAAEKGQLFQVGQNRPAQVVPSALVDEAGRPLGQTVIPGEVAKYPGSSLHAMKMAFDDLIKNPERFGIGAAEVSAIKNTRAQFLNWVEDKVAAYRTARKTFTKQSEPINQMEVGQFLESKLKPVLGEETARLRASGFASAIENAPSTIKRATGESRFQTLSEVLTPEQIKIVEDVRADLARAQLAERQSAAARDIGPNTGAAATEAMQGIRSPNFMSKISTVANELLRRLQGKLDRKLATEIAMEMLDPSAAADALEKAMVRQSKLNRLADPFTKTGKLSSNMLRTPAAFNMTAPEYNTENNLTRNQ